MTKTIKGETVLSGVSMELFGGKIFWNGEYIKDSLQGVLRLGLYWKTSDCTRT